MRAFFGSMAGRVFLTLVAGIVASAALSFTLAQSERHRFVSHMRTLHMAERIEQFVRALDALPPMERPKILTAARSAGLLVEFARQAEETGEPDAELAAALRDRLGKDRKIVATKGGDARCGPRHVLLGINDRTQPAACRMVFLALQDGTVLRLALENPRERATFTSQPRMWLYYLLFPACIGGLAYLVSRMSTQPLSRLARAATGLGRDIDRPPLPESGPTEVRRAAAAFNAMQTRIRRHIQERTQMLAAIAHDLQTPLTRLRLRLEKVGDNELREKLIADLSAMEEMVREGLELARSTDATEAMHALDLDSLLDSVCTDAADAGQDVTLDGRTGVSIMARPNALRRCLTNLIDNAVKYGNFAHVSTSREGSKVVIRIIDGGQGIPEEFLETVFDPFFRMETSRSRETGGTGLGLAISRNIAEQHGGTLRLQNHPSGGLEAVLELTIPAGK